MCERCKKVGYSDCEYRDIFERTWRWQNSKSMNIGPTGGRELLRSRPIKINPSVILVGSHVLFCFMSGPARSCIKYLPTSAPVPRTHH